MKYEFIINPQLGIEFIIFVVMGTLLTYISYRLFKAGKTGITLALRTFGNISLIMFDGIKTLEELKQNNNSRFFRAIYIKHPKTFLYGCFFLIIAILIVLMTFVEIRAG